MNGKYEVKEIIKERSVKHEIFGKIVNKLVNIDDMMKHVLIW